MSSRWIRTAPGARETLGASLAAATVALGAGLLTFYLIRLLLAREGLSRTEDAAPSDTRAARDEQP